MGNYAKNDDGIGLRIIEHIIDNNLDDGFKAIEAANDGIKALTFFTEETEEILFVDCALIDKQPGEFLIFSPEDVETKKITGTISTHEGDIIKLFQLAEETGCHIPKISILAIQPESLGMGMTLSEALETRLGSYVHAAIGEITR